MERTDERATHPGPGDRRDARLPRRQRLVLRQVHPSRRRPGLARAVPHQHAPRLHRRARRDAARACASTPAPAGAAAASSSGSTRAPGWATSPSTSRWRCSSSSATTSGAARPGRSRARRASTTSSTATSTRTSASRPAASPIRLVNHLVEGDPDFDWETERDAFIRRAERTAFGPSTQAIVDEAVSRDIPWIRLNQYSLVQLGQGVHAKRIRATMTSETCSIAVDIASDKDLTTKLLGAAGLPVPKQEFGPYGGRRRRRPPDRIGYPVVAQAARRQPRARGLPRPPGRGRRTRCLPDRGRAVPPRQS